MVDQPANLSDMLDKLDEACGDGDGERVSVENIWRHIGRRSFGPMLLVPALVAMSPLGGIPGLPTAVAVIVVLVAGQLLIGMNHFWIPRFVAHRSVEASQVEKSVEVARPVARFVDRLLKPRLKALTHGAATYVIAATCILLALLMPPLELVPFGVAAPAGAVAAFGLALIANDGVLALIAFVLSAASLYLVATTLLL